MKTLKFPQGPAQVIPPESSPSSHTDRVTPEGESCTTTQLRKSRSIHMGVKPGKLIVLAGVPFCGKGYLVHRYQNLLRRNGSIDNWFFAPRVTTRAPRLLPHGKLESNADYIFVDPPRFRLMWNASQLICERRIGSHDFGIARSVIDPLRQGKNALLKVSIPEIPKIWDFARVQNLYIQVVIILPKNDNLSIVQEAMSLRSCPNQLSRALFQEAEDQIAFLRGQQDDPCFNVGSGRVSVLEWGDSADIDRLFGDFNLLIDNANPPH